MTPSERVALDKRIAEEGFVALDEPESEPEGWWRLGTVVPRVWTMDERGQVGPWQWGDSMSWIDAIAYRLETMFGLPIKLDDFEGEEWV